MDSTILGRERRAKPFPVTISLRDRTGERIRIRAFLKTQSAIRSAPLCNPIPESRIRKSNKCVTFHDLLRKQFVESIPQQKEKNDLSIYPHSPFNHDLWIGAFAPTGKNARKGITFARNDEHADLGRIIKGTAYK
jgi:hypothetical protein